MASLYTDEHFPLSVTLYLRTRGHDVLTAQEAGNADQRIPDESVLAFAIEQQRAVITMNRRHFVRLHQVQPEHCGIIVCTQYPDFRGQAQRIDQLIEDAGPLPNKLLRVYRPS